MTLYKGLGQLEAYTEEQEGVSFQMDNGMFWNSVDDDGPFAIQASEQKTYSSKFFVTVTDMDMGKVALRDCRGLYLAPRRTGDELPIYPLHPMHWRPQISSEFKVFHYRNKVAFQTHDGRFLAKGFRGVILVEAVKTTVDSSCLFRPLIGDLLPPFFNIIKVNLGELTKMKCNRCVLKKQTYVNRTDEPQDHIFTLTWAEEVTQTTVWTHKWGLGLVTTTDFQVMDTKATLKYNEDNDKVVCVSKTIRETLTEEMELPPKTKATARLVVYQNENAVISFKARILKMKPDGTQQGFVEPGAWRGLIYFGLKMEIKVEPLGISCAAM